MPAPMPDHVHFRVTAQARFTPAGVEVGEWSAETEPGGAPSPANSFSPGGAQVPPTSEVTEPTVRRVTPGQASTGGVLDRIDATVDELCGCGCERALRPDGPSAFFATQECQSRWLNATQVDSPDDVYTRPDANLWDEAAVRAAERRRLNPPPFPGPTTPNPPLAPVYDHTSIPNPPQPGGRVVNALWRQERDLAGHRPLVPGWWRSRTGVLFALGYRRWCGECEAYTEPGHVPDDNDLVRSSTDPISVYHSPTYGCLRCNTAYRTPMPQAELAWNTDPRTYQFRLRIGDAASQLNLDAATVHTAPDPRSLADRTWQQVERAVADMRETRTAAVAFPVLARTTSPADFIRRLLGGGA